VPSGGVPRRRGGGGGSARPHAAAAREGVTGTFPHVGLVGRPPSIVAAAPVRRRALHGLVQSPVRENGGIGGGHVLLAHLGATDAVVVHGDANAQAAQQVLVQLADDDEMVMTAVAVPSARGRVPCRARQSVQHLAGGVEEAIQERRLVVADQMRAQLGGKRRRGGSVVVPSAVAAAEGFVDAVAVKLLAKGLACRSCSITPKLTPEPPCTATPAGLSMAIKASSSNNRGNSRPGAGLAAFSATLSEILTGGSRTTSPVSMRVSAEARPLFTRTSPLRIIR